MGSPPVENLQPTSSKRNNTVDTEVFDIANDDRIVDDGKNHPDFLRNFQPPQFSIFGQFFIPNHICPTAHRTILVSKDVDFC